MSKFVSYNESIVNLDKVSQILCDSGSIKFFAIDINKYGNEPIEVWYFENEETALESWELLKSKLGTINLEPL
jgi:hypothetical protein